MPLRLFALAEVRSDEVRAALPRCEDCPPDCVRALERPLLGEAAWPVCPMALLRDPVWRAIVERFIARLVAPLADWPDGYTCLAHDAMIELFLAQGAERERLRREAEQSPHGIVWDHSRVSGGAP